MLIKADIVTLRKTLDLGKNNLLVILNFQQRKMNFVISIQEYTAKLIKEYPEDMIFASGSSIYEIILIQNNPKKCFKVGIDKFKLFEMEDYGISIECNNKIIDAVYLAEKKTLVFITSVGHIYTQIINKPHSSRKIQINFHPHEKMIELRYHPRKNVIVLRTTNSLFFYNENIEEIYKVISNGRSIELSDVDNEILLFYCIYQKEIIY